MGAETNNYCDGKDLQQSNQSTTHLILLWDIIRPLLGQEYMHEYIHSHIHLHPSIHFDMFNPPLPIYQSVYPSIHLI
jgi:hypothetical protein